jgi:hypothetical protein
MLFRIGAPAALAVLLAAGAAAGDLEAPYQIDGMAVDLRDRGADPAADPTFVFLVDLDPLQAPTQGDADRWTEATVLTEAGPVRAGLMDIRKSCQFLCGTGEEETCHYQAALVLDYRQDTGGNVLAAFPGSVEVTDFQLLEPVPLTSAPSWSREFRPQLWPADEATELRIDRWDPSTERLRFSVRTAGGEEHSLDDQGCRAGTAAGLTHVACQGVALIAADGVPLLLSWPDYNIASAAPVASFEHDGALHVLVRLGLKAQTVYGLLVKRGDKWVPLFRKAERPQLC